MEKQDSMQEKEQEDSVYSTVDRFFRYYLTDRDAGKALSLLSDHIYSIGAGNQGIANGKQAFRALLENEIRSLPAPIPYQITRFNQRQRMPGCWHCLCSITMLLPLPGGDTRPIPMHLTAGLHEENGTYIIDVLHASQPQPAQEEGAFLPVNLILEKAKGVHVDARCVPFDLLSQMMPGGIVGSYDAEGFPLYVANDRLLDMAGYATYEEFSQDIQGLVINSIHPDDREYVSREIGRILSISDQYEIEYRMKRKDGSYFWVHDIGRWTVAEDGRRAIICALIDISSQVDIQKSLQDELAKDPLTGVYNRKGGYDRIARDMETCGSYLFFMLDLDNFKQVNDIYGHEQGDQALCYIAGKLLGSFRKTDTVFRLGGDEFGVFIPNCPAGGAIECKLRNIIDDYETMMHAHWPAARSSLSVGGIYGRRSRVFTELYQMADKILCEVKKGEKGQLKIQLLEED